MFSHFCTTVGWGGQASVAVFLLQEVKSERIWLCFLSVLQLVEVVKFMFFFSRKLIFYSKEVNKWCVPFPGSDKSVVYRTVRDLLSTNRIKKPVSFSVIQGWEIVEWPDCLCGSSFRTFYPWPWHIDPWPRTCLTIDFMYAVLDLWAG